MARWTAAQIGDQTGRSFVVTGANSGLGYETARQLARRGGRVLLTTRTETKGLQAVGRLRREFPDAEIEHGVLDLADLDSVRAFAATITTGQRAVDVLVNNAV
jgi:NAD(P)-dependent dehydrogenase (short-subunit alcohol dehydrogenase family)